MKAPDKIYIQPNAHDRWFEGNMPNDNFVEYIRKDALLEWANRGLTFRKNGVILDDGFSYAMEELIKKLNSM